MSGGGDEVDFGGARLGVAVHGQLRGGVDVIRCARECSVHGAVCRGIEVVHLLGAVGIETDDPPETEPYCVRNEASQGVEVWRYETAVLA